MPDSYYLSAIRSNAKTYQSELNELHKILSERNLSTFEYRAAERSLQVSIEAAIGVAKHWAKSLAGSSPSEAYQAFEVISQHQHLTLDQLTNWRKVIGLRNALVHDYLNIDPNIVRSIIAQGYYAQVFDFINVGTAALESIQ
ncbi:hypothetical protein MGA5115_01723 [Marinomonas gallaica]|uniref:DUF86 domain-containing protein n=1 Tax=Marinomonas gallaica TaxID=1806667 RepID=A0A1C3JR79_9GAMM|nr:DUF86 domain-containing protein [Marinomonas gallaica]SBT17607.1 hypothetical protein MGA5115_01723 [Marinomonas gallaica]SBT19933.1 hypothetical protein MGA5116_00516 [Marinomonas gallaica]